MTQVMQTWSPDVYAKAWQFATIHHQGQTYGGPTEGVEISYLSHIGSVAMEVIWALPATPEADGNLAIQCALLHDVLEDTSVTYNEVLDAFGEAVADGVLALTKNDSLPTKATQMADSLERIQAQPHEVWMVKMADRITNLYHPPYYWNRGRTMKYRDEAMVIYRALHSANPVLANRLKAKITAYQRFL